MQSSKALYSTCFEEYKLDDEKLKQLQGALLDMFLDVKKVCDEHDIKYMLSGGSLLGAVRHQGFIPWDDDIDLMMLRSEYEKLRDVFEKELSEKYILAEPLSDKRYFCKMPKIFKKGTTYVEIPNAGVHGYDMLFLDVFIIENVPESPLARKLRGKIYDIAFKGASVCIDYLYPSPVILEKAKVNAELDHYYRFRRRLGCVFSHLGGVYFYLRICEKLGNYKKNTQWLGVPSAISYEREVLPRKVFTEVDSGKFCGYNVKIPKNYDKYLKNLYRDYMEIPPIDKREVHGAYKINF